jgi:hypothetical protein
LFVNDIIPEFCVCRSGGQKLVNWWIDYKSVTNQLQIALDKSWKMAMIIVRQGKLRMSFNQKRNAAASFESCCSG